MEEWEEVGRWMVGGEGREDIAEKAAHAAVVTAVPPLKLLMAPGTVES